MARKDSNKPVHYRPSDQCPLYSIHSEVSNDSWVLPIKCRLNKAFVGYIMGQGPFSNVCNECIHYLKIF